MNKLENKFKFFAQYWGQKILTDKYGNPNTSWIDFSSMSNTGAIRQGLILLKPLSSISDEDAIALAKHLGYDINHASDEYYASIGRRHTKQSLITAEVVDFIRAKGYAHDWNGITVEQQIEYGWIKLIKQ